LQKSLEFDFTQEGRMVRKILLADDSITIQKVVNLTFSDEGIDVVTVGNGELALRKLNDVRPDIVLADIYMPGKNGYEVCEYIKTNSQFSQIPVLLLVGAFEPFDQAEALRVKADGHLTKPFESRALIATVTRLLAQAPPHPPPPSPPAATPVQASPAKWKDLPPDSTTTRLSMPGMASEYIIDLPKVEPIRASPVPIEQLQPPIAFPYSTPTAPTTPSIFSAPATNEKPAAKAKDSSTSSSNISGLDLTVSSNSTPPASPFSTNPSMKFSSTAENLNATTEERLDELELPAEILKSETKDGVASNVTTSYTASSIDSISPLELDEVEVTSLHLTTYQAREAENQDEDITPLDLEPLEELIYQPTSLADTVLEISPDPLPIEELTAVDAEDVIEGNIPKLETMDSISVEPAVSEDLKETISMVSLPEPEPVVSSSDPNFELVTEEAETVATSYSDTLPLESEQMPVFDLEKEPELPEAIAPVFELEKEPALQTPMETPTEEFTFELPEEETEPVAEEAVTEVKKEEPAVEEPMFDPMPEPAQLEPQLEPQLELQPEPQPEPVAAASIIETPAMEEPVAEVTTAGEVVQSVAASSAPAAITSIDQIPQHLIDEIVQRVVSKMTEEVVREIAWEVVPDLAELLIKKRLEDQKILR
jgi:CheY-like chemotaxis protein